MSERVQEFNRIAHEHAVSAVHRDSELRDREIYSWVIRDVSDDIAFLRPDHRTRFGKDPEQAGEFNKTVSLREGF